jgi:hypothetical protein
MLQSTPKYVYGADVSVRLKHFKDRLPEVQHQHQWHFQELPPRSFHPVATLQEYVVVQYDAQHIALVCHPYLPKSIAEDAQALFARIFG